MKTAKQPTKKELRELSENIDSIKRKNWDVSDEVIEAYIAGKDKGEKDYKKNVITKYINKLQSIQVSVESVYDKLKSKNINCQKAFMRMDAFNFSVIFVIDNSDFVDEDKRKICYQVSKESRSSIDENESLVTFRFTSDQDLNFNLFELNGFDVSFR